MSSTPNAVQQGQYPHIAIGVQMLEERLAPAKISDSGGGAFFNAWFALKRLNPGNMTAGQIADAMYDAVLADCGKPPKERQLKWAVPPKMIQREIDLAKNRPASAQDVREASTFEQRVRESERKDADAKAQAAARKQALDLIERFSPLNHRTGRPTYEVPLVGDNGRPFRDSVTGAIKRVSIDALRAEWRTRVAGAKDAIKVLEAIKAETIRIYSYLEKEAERV